MDDETRKRIEPHRIGSADASKLPPGLMKMIRHQSAGQFAEVLLERYDAGELDAAAFVEFIRQWLKGPEEKKVG